MPGSAESNERAQYWQDQINHWRASSGPQAAFCKAHDLSIAKISYWWRKFDERPARFRGFALVKFQNADTKNLSTAFPNGLVIQGIPAGNTGGSVPATGNTDVNRMLRPAQDMSGTHLYRNPADFRKSFRGLAAIVEQEQGHNPFVGGLYFLRSSN